MKMDNPNEDRAELFKKLFFLTFSFTIIRFNYDNSISVGALLQNFEILDDILTILVPLAILIMIYYFKKHNYKYIVYIIFVFAVILIADVVWIEKTEIIKLEKFIKYYPIYIALTFLASFMADIASQDFRAIRAKVQDKVDSLVKEYTLKFINIFLK